MPLPFLRLASRDLFPNPLLVLAQRVEGSPRDEGVGIEPALAEPQQSGPDRYHDKTDDQRSEPPGNYMGEAEDCSCNQGQPAAESNQPPCSDCAGPRSQAAQLFSDFSLEECDLLPDERAGLVGEVRQQCRKWTVGSGTPSRDVGSETFIRQHQWDSIIPDDPAA